MKLKNKAFGAMLLLAGIAASNVAMAGCPAPIALPTATALNSTTFGDGISYSLPILGIDVQSSPGQIDDCIVIMTGADGTPVTTNAAGMDNAYESPSGTQSFFRTGDPTVSPDPGTLTVTEGGTAVSWDIRVDALNTFLQGDDLVVFFNHNQEGSGTGSINEDIFIWAQIRVVDDLCVDPATGLPLSTDACTAAGGLATQYFYVTSVPNIFQATISNFGQPGGSPLAYTGPQTLATSTYPSGADGTCSNPPGTFDAAGTFPSGDAGTGTGSGDACFMVRAIGQICTNAAGLPVDCNDPTAVNTFNENLGAEQVANAIIFPEIQAILDSGLGYDVLQVDLRIGCNPATVGTTGCTPGAIANNGFEQIFIARGVVQVPEPATLALVALGLLGLGVRIRRKA